MVNAHSHAFQRLLRGRVQRRCMGQEDSFWTWRESMYELANSLDVQAIEDASRLCFVECLEAGYTAVGEFHYLHNQPSGQPYADPMETTNAVLRAARQAHIRLCLLWTVYVQGGFKQALSPRQQRFSVLEQDDVRRALDRLEQLCDQPRTSYGLALHSVRAVPSSWLGPLAEEARSRGIPVHIHVSEQPKEVSDCQAATGHTPVSLLAQEDVLGPGTTLVHGTWLTDEDVELIARSGCTVCVCPTTEGDLGDGIPRTADLVDQGVPLAIGSDSHAVIDPWAELRTLEYQARASTGRRCVVTDQDGQVAPALLEVGHDHGYRCLGLSPEGDRVWMDGDARLFDGSEDLLATAVTAGHPGVVREVEVGGERVVAQGRHLA